MLSADQRPAVSHTRCVGVSFRLGEGQSRCGAPLAAALADFGADRSACVSQNWSVGADLCAGHACTGPQKTSARAHFDGGWPNLGAQMWSAAAAGITVVAKPKADTSPQPSCDD